MQKLCAVQDSTMERQLEVSLRWRSFQQLRSRDHRLRDLGDLLALVHGRLAQQGVGCLFGEIFRGHENALGAVDHLAFLERGARALELVPQAGEGIEARDAEIEDVLDAPLLQASDDVGGDAGIDGSLDRGLVALIDEHGDGPLHRPADLEHLFEHVAARILEVNQDDVGVEGVDASEQVRGLGEAHHVNVAGLAQPVLQDRRADRILVDDDDLERRLHGRRRQFSSPVPSRADPRFSNSINLLSAKPTPARSSRRAPLVKSWAAPPSKDAGPSSRRSNVHRGAFRSRANHAFIPARRFSQMLGWSIHAARAWLTCASTRTCTFTRNTRGRRAGISISSTSPPGRAAKASAWSAPAISPIRSGAPSSSRSSFPPSPASIACATTSSRRLHRRYRRRAAPRCASCSRSKSPPSTRRPTAPAKSITSSTPPTSRPSIACRRGSPASATSRPTAARFSASIPATYSKSHSNPVRTPIWCRRISGRRGLRRWDRNPASIRLPSATAISPTAFSLSRPASRPTRP